MTWGDHTGQRYAGNVTLSVNKAMDRARPIRGQSWQQLANERAGRALQGLHGVFSKSFVKTIIKINVTQALRAHTPSLSLLCNMTICLEN